MPKNDGHPSNKHQSALDFLKTTTNQWGIQLVKV